MAEKKSIEGRDALAQRIRKIYEAKELTEADKDRMIAELLPQSSPPSGGLEPGKTALAYLVSFLLPLSGLVFAVHYLFHYEEAGRKVSIICTILTVIGFLLLLWIFNALTAVMQKTPF